MVTVCRISLPPAASGLGFIPPVSALEAYNKTNHRFSHRVRGHWVTIASWGKTLLRVASTPTEDHDQLYQQGATKDITRWFPCSSVGGGLCCLNLKPVHWSIVRKQQHPVAGLARFRRRLLWMMPTRGSVDHCGLGVLTEPFSPPEAIVPKARLAQGRRGRRYGPIPWTCPTAAADAQRRVST